MITLIWAAVKPWLKSLNLWALVALVGLCVAIYWGSIIRDQRKQAREKAAAEAASAAATVQAATATAKAAQAAEASTPLPADKAAIIDLCRKSASCRERGLK